MLMTPTHNTDNPLPRYPHVPSTTLCLLSVKRPQLLRSCFSAIAFLSSAGFVVAVPSLRTTMPAA